MKAATIGSGIVVTRAQKTPEVATAIIIAPVIMPGSLWKYMIRLEEAY